VLAAGIGTFRPRPLPAGGEFVGNARAGGNVVNAAATNAAAGPSVVSRY
jgi:hypothetical protein